MPKTPVRREGFAGQHQAVVPAPVRKAASTHALLKSLLVTDAGYYPAATGHRVERPQGASTHVVILCLHGKGWAKGGEKTVRVQQGDFIWLSADSPHAYGAIDSDPWSIVWAHFQGEEVSSWRKELGWAEKSALGHFHFGAERVGTLGLDKVYAILEAG